MSPTFGLSFLLSILAAWILIKKSNWGHQVNKIFRESKIGTTIIAAIVIAFGLGLYQANLACTCVIIIVAFIKMIMEDKSNKSLIDYILRSFIALIMGCIIYKIIWSFYLNKFNILPASYNGADSISVKDMIICFPQNILKTYKIFPPVRLETINAAKLRIIFM